MLGLFGGLPDGFQYEAFFAAGPPSAPSSSATGSAPGSAPGSSAPPSGAPGSSAGPSASPGSAPDSTHQEVLLRETLQTWISQRSPGASAKPHNVKQSLQKFAERRGFPCHLRPKLLELGVNTVLAGCTDDGQPGCQWPKLQVLAMDEEHSAAEVSELRALHRRFNTLSSKQGP